MKCELCQREENSLEPIICSSCTINLLAASVERKQRLVSKLQSEGRIIASEMIEHHFLPTYIPTVDRDMERHRNNVLKALRGSA